MLEKGAAVRMLIFPVFPMAPHSLLSPNYICSCRHFFFPLKMLIFILIFHFIWPFFSFNREKRGFLCYNGQPFHTFSFGTARQFLKKLSGVFLSRNNAVFCHIRYFYCFIPSYLNFGPCCTQGCGKQFFLCDFSILHVWWKYRII